MDGMYGKWQGIMRSVRGVCEVAVKYCEWQVNMGSGSEIWELAKIIGMTEKYEKWYEIQM